MTRRTTSDPESRMLAATLATELFIAQITASTDPLDFAPADLLRWSRSIERYIATGEIPA